MKVGIVGCGLNSAYHIRFAKSYPGVEIIGLVDREKGRAFDCAERFGISKTFSSIQELVGYSKPDVIHIVTPPATHHALAKEAIQSACHVLVEKPMTLTAPDARELYALAEKKGLKLCTMHNHFFDPCMARAHRLIESGQAGRIINVESYYGLNTRIDAFRRYPAPNVLPWIYTLPGGIFQDFMSHPLYVMLPYVGKPCRIEVMEKSFGELPRGISDEVRILIDGERAFGYVTLSFSAKPHLQFLRIYGEKMAIHVDFSTMSTTVHTISRLPKAAQKATYNLSEAQQLILNTASNVWNFAWGKLRPYQGMETLIHRFYDAIKGNARNPVEKEEALAVLETMDEIGSRIKPAALHFETIIPREHSGERGKGRVLVTGATGFLGRRLVRTLTERGYCVRALARKLSNVESLLKFKVGVFYGDVADADSISPAFEDIDCVIHAAADTEGDGEIGRKSTVEGTQNVIQRCRESRVKKLIYISSCSIYGVAGCKENQLITEESPLENRLEERGAYTHSKLEAEKAVFRSLRSGGPATVCLRPGTIWGPGGAYYSPLIGFSAFDKLFFVIGKDEFRLPLVYIDNLVDAILLSIQRDEASGEIFNVVDFMKPSKKEYMDRLVKSLIPNASIIYIPVRLVYGIVCVQEMLLRFLHKQPILTRYRFLSSQKNVIYDASKIRDVLGWSPNISLETAIERYVKDRQEDANLKRG